MIFIKRPPTGGTGNTVPKQQHTRSYKLHPGEFWPDWDANNRKPLTRPILWIRSLWLNIWLSCLAPIHRLMIHSLFQQTTTAATIKTTIKRIESGWWHRAKPNLNPFFFPPPAVLQFGIAPEGLQAVSLIRLNQSSSGLLSNFLMFSALHTLQVHTGQFLQVQIDINPFICTFHKRGR